MKLKLLLIGATFTSMLLAQDKNDFPINPATGLISINNVISVKGKNRAALKEMAQSYFSSKNSTAILTESETNYAKRMKEVPKFTGGLTMNSDSLLVYNMIMKIY